MERRRLRESWGHAESKQAITYLLPCQALLYNSPRAASIRALEPCVYWSLERNTFQRILNSSNAHTMAERCTFLKEVPLLKGLSNREISKLSGAMSETSFVRGENIISQGERGDTFFVIHSGTAKAAKQSRGKLVSLALGFVRDHYFFLPPPPPPPHTPLPSSRIPD